MHVQVLVQFGSATGLAEGVLGGTAAVFDAVHESFCGKGFQGAVHGDAVGVLEQGLHVGEAEGGRVLLQHVEHEQAHGRGGNLPGDEKVFEGMSHAMGWG